MSNDPKKDLVKIAANVILNVLLNKYFPSTPSNGKTQSPDEEDYELRPIIGRFSTRNKEFGSAVLDIVSLIEDYATRARVDRPLNILFAAAPGTGKSFLAKQMAKALAERLKHKDPKNEGVSFEEVHVAAFRSADDLLGVFQRVQSANLKGQFPIVLFDEVDGKVNDSYLLANFLAPMWDGKFYVGKDSYALGRAVFCFAASNMVPSPIVEPPPRNELKGRTPTLESYSTFSERWRTNVASHVDEMTKKGTIPKCKHFVDRIDVMVCIPPVDERLLAPEDAAGEYMDLAFSWITNHFPQVERIEKAAMVALQKKLLIEKTSRRDAERSIFISTTPGGKDFLFSDLPKRDQEKYSNDEVVNANKGKYFKVKKSS